jgi:hypothetical protein
MIGTFHKCHKFIVTVNLASKAYRLMLLDFLHLQLKLNEANKINLSKPDKKKTLRKLQTKFGDHPSINL